MMKFTVQEKERKKVRMKSEEVTVSVRCPRMGRGKHEGKYVTGFVDDKMTSERTWEEAAARCTVFTGRFVWAGGSQSSSSSPH